MTKKIICFVFALVMILSFSACGDKAQDTVNKATDDFAKFQEVQENMSGLKDAECKATLERNRPDEEGGNTTTSSTVKQVIKSKDDIQLSMDYIFNKEGNNVKGKMYVKDQTMYMDTMGHKIKMTDKSQVDSMIASNTNNFFTITEDLIADLKVDQENDDTIYYFELKPEKALNYISKVNGGSEVMTEEVKKDITDEKMDITIVVGKDKMAKSIDYFLSLSVKADDQIITMSDSLSMEYLSINTGLEIDFPDFSKYKEESL